MGSAFELSVVQEEQTRAEELLNLGIEEIKRIESLLSEFLPGSETSRINNLAGHEPIPVNKECFDLLERSLNISRLTKGSFDISIGQLKKIYSFKNENFLMPLDSHIKETRQNVGYEHIVLDKKDFTVNFRNNRLKISFAAIGKGYAADKVKQIWQQEGVRSGYINASGDLTAFGTKPDGNKWKIGIANPDDKRKILMYIPLNNVSAATSGDYEQFFMHNNTRYSHNINPHTGLPVSGIKSVSIFSPSAELSDALATAVYVMGIKQGIQFVNQLPQTHCIIIDDRNQVYFSKKLRYEEILC